MDSVTAPGTGAASTARRSIADGIAGRVAEQIMSGDLLPGIRLEEEALANRFGVSRTPVREALHQLVATGLVAKRPQGGAIVTEIDRARLDAMFEAMAELEAAGARLAALRMTDAERRALVAAHRSSRRWVRDADHASYEAFNVDFHAMIYDGGRNAELAAMLRAMRRRVAPYRRAQFRLPGRLAASYAEHDRVIAAIQDTDADAASTAMRAHLQLVSGASLEILRARAGASVSP